MADTTNKNFVENVNHVAKLDNSLASSLIVSRSQVVLVDDIQYDYDCVIAMFNRSTLQTEYNTISGTTLTNDTLVSTLLAIKTAIEQDYACTMTYTVTVTESSIAKFNAITITFAVSGDAYYVRDMVLVISDINGVKYQLVDRLNSPVELIPSMLNVTPEALVGISQIGDLAPLLESVVLNEANISAVAGSIANVNTIASIQNLANMTTVANDLNAMDLNGIADVTVVANNLVLGAASSINIVSADKVNIDAVAANKANIDAVAANEANINAVVGSAAAVAADVLLTHADVVLTHADVALTGADVISADASADIATTQAGIATTKAGEALASANASEASRVAAAGILDSFDDRYLGAKSSEPLLDNDGNALLEGALYFDSTTKKMRVWDSLSWGDALTLTASSVGSLTNKTIDSITNTVGADHVHYKVRNASGSTIAIGTVLAASGSQPGTDYIQVVPVTDPQTQVAIGVAHTTLLNNGIGLALNTGVEDDTDTSAWTVGTILYVGASGFTDVKPISGRYQTCAYVLRQHAIHGTLLCEFTEPQMIASTTQSGSVQLNDTLTSTSTAEALTAAQGKALQDGKQPLDGDLTAIAAIAGTTGLLKKTAVNTWSLDTSAYVTSSGVTSVTGTAPVVSSGGNTPAISMAAASSGVNGYMTGTYATKLDGIAANANNYTLPVGSSTVIGGMKLFSDVVQSVVANAVSTTASRSYGLQLNASGQLVVNVPWADTNTFPTTYTWTDGSTAGPTASITGTSSTIAVAAIPSASATVSGIVTTGAQTFAGVKTLTSPVLVTPNIGVATGTSFNSITGLASVAPLAPAVTAVIGASPLVARQDHVHPTNFTATATDIKMNGTQSVGALTTFSRADHVHPVDTSRAALATSVQKDSDTGVVYLASGTTAQRPTLVNGVVGIRYNTTLSSSEVGVGTAGATAWSPVGGGGATGGGADTVFVETSYTVTQDYTITAGKSAITVGDANGNVTIQDGVTVTIPDGASWAIVGA